MGEEEEVVWLGTQLNERKVQLEIREDSDAPIVSQLDRADEMRPKRNKRKCCDS
jgi:alpha-D-ribose 1-methylphosphonate 5-triphosphate synthase subunit PhnH